MGLEAIEKIERDYSLSAEELAELRQFAKDLKDPRFNPTCLAMEAKLQFLLVRRDHGMLQKAVRESGLGWCDRWRLQRGESLPDRRPGYSPLREDKPNFK
ncbi:hypothetical protein AB3R30_18775 [Leptolyngbyaceae cyanobacterium UHCC 1019]